MRICVLCFRNEISFSGPIIIHFFSSSFVISFVINHTKEYKFRNAYVLHLSYELLFFWDIWNLGMFTWTCISCKHKMYCTWLNLLYRDVLFQSPSLFLYLFFRMCVSLFYFFPFSSSLCVHIRFFTFIAEAHPTYKPMSNLFVVHSI